MRNLTILKIDRKKVASYLQSKTATIDIDDVDYICIDGVVVKDQVVQGVDYETISRNEGGTFSLNWEHSNMKILFILKESYIMKDSFYMQNDRGNHKMNTLYDNNSDLWENPTYRNIVKLSYYTYLSINGLSSIMATIDFKNHETWNEACEVFRNNVAVVSANPFPALAFNISQTNDILLRKWLQLPEIKNQLKQVVDTLSPNIIYSGFDLGTVSSYSHLFGFLKGRSLSELVDTEGTQYVLGRAILSGGVLNGAPYVVDNRHIPWIQGKHPSGIHGGHKKMQEIANTMKLLCNGNK